MFYGRKKELEYLNEVFESSKAEFITLYGRRRIGKTELLKTFVKDKKHIFYSAKECTDYEQLLSISSKILGKGRQFENWDALFEYLGEQALKEKLCIIIDEFPYIVKGNGTVASVIQNCWDHLLKDTNIKLIICGSSMSFIEKEVLSEKNPLYGRMTGIYKLNELTFEETAEFFPDYSIDNLITCYSILGGVPYYLLQFEKSKSIADNISCNILNKGKVLYNEVDFLIKQELREPQVYYTIIEKIAFGATKLNEIHQKTQINTNKLAVYLKNLIELGFIKREYPVTEKIKAKVNLHSGLYRLNNRYFEFYFRFIFPFLSDLEEGLIEDVYSYEIEPNLNDYISNVYEELCIHYLKKKIYKEKFPYRIRYIGRWWQKGEEIDIVGFTDYQFVFGECKWRNQKCDIKVYEQLLKKTEEYFKYNEGHYYLFSKSGFTEKLIELSRQNQNLHLFENFNEI